ncbi:Aldehyde dehydrogenase [Mycena sanguinolenta]|uniref:Aldehyde dehydrogenase n=1 Tax=Mycena sanguinolenta TaxID=230812 RepID=A0A8H6Y3F0_9AGAR|nr:Aldehyde dehydrogenase [Mycena sanguinolenta]
MKRGFLNGSKAKSRPLGPISTSEPAPLPRHIKFPIGKQDKVDISLPDGFADPKLQYKECDPRGGSTPGVMNYTSIPFVTSSDDDEQVSECLFYPGSKEVLMQIPNFPHPILRVETPAFRVADVSGKGLGLVSMRALKMGDLILDERPLFVCTRGVPVLVPSTFTQDQIIQYHLQKLEEHYQLSISRMRPKAKTAYMALSNCHKEDRSGPIVGIVRTNGLALQGLRPGVEDETNEYSAICKDISRLNHSCSPNTAPRFHKPSFSYRLYAVRDIAEGEELTYQYTDVMQSAAKRQAELKPYDFVCACPACKDPSTSDPRRVSVAKFWAANSGMLTFSFLNDTLFAKCRKQIELIIGEGLEHHPVYFDVVRLLMEGCIAYGDAQGASEWAAKLDKCHWDENRNNKDVLELLKSGPPYEEHPLWRTLIDAGVPGQPKNMTQMLKQLAELAGPGGSTMVPGGAGMIFHPRMT